MSGAYVGLTKALIGYRGGESFLLRAKMLANVYCSQALRSELKRGGMPLTDKQMHLMGKLIAARAQAWKAKGSAPTPTEIASVWRVRKVDVSTGKNTTLGVYESHDDDGEPVMVDQGKEPTPMGSWRIRGPDGAEVGKSYDGKVKRVEKLLAMLDAKSGEQGSDWFDTAPIGVLPRHAAVNMNVGTALAVQAEVHQTLGQMKPEYRAVLEAMWFGPGADSRRAGRALTGIADVLGIKGSDATKRRKVNEILEPAIRQFRTLARGEAKKHAKGWTRPAPGGLGTDETERFGHAALRDRFGSDERVSLFLAGMRAGNRTRTEKVLDAEARGEAQPADSQWVRKQYHQQRDKERIAAFHAHAQTRVVDAAPNARRTPGEADWLYPDTILTDYAQALMKNGLPKSRPAKMRDPRYKVLSEERFKRFMGYESEDAKAARAAAEALQPGNKE